MHLTNSFEEMEDITTNTRNIAALAARRRSRAFLNATEAGHQRSNSDDNKLTVSRLAYHDNKYALGQQSRTAIDDSASNFTDQEGFSTQRSNQNRHKYHKKTTKKLPPMQFGAMNTRHRSRSHEPKQVRKFCFVLCLQELWKSWMYYSELSRLWKWVKMQRLSQGLSDGVSKCMSPFGRSYMYICTRVKSGGCSYDQVAWCPLVSLGDKLQSQVLECWPHKSGLRLDQHSTAISGASIPVGTRN